ncbi:MAG: hypothetical protein IPK13_16515 [Deltaproteobacteria bacterium]|nr:hypothetical protein [Deltaproteobacteria bacterium]
MNSHISHLFASICFAGLAAVGTVACGDDDPGTLAVAAYGEAFIEEGIPSSEMGDGWSIQFEHFNIAFEDVVVAGAALSVPSSIDLTRPSSGAGQTLGTATIAEGEYTGARFTVSRVEARGTATKGADTKSFDWVFDQPTRYSDCDARTKVGAGAQATLQVTIHADHLFYDSLVSSTPQLLFQPLADADQNDDGNVTEEELAAQDIGNYDPGSEDGIDDLWTWLNALASTLGHVDGEGHCHATVVR